MSHYQSESERGPGVLTIIALLFTVLFILFGGIGSCMFIAPNYHVWEQRMAGEAELSRAQQNRQISESDAQAAVAKAKGDAQAEIERAKGNAEANKIISNGLGGPEGYLTYLKIQAITNHPGAIIYVPTEAGVPILEAGKRAEPKP